MTNGGRFFINSAQSTVGALADCYMPENSGGNGGAHSRHFGTHPECGIFVLKPRRIVHHYEWDEFVDYVDWRGHESLRASHRIEEPSVRSFSSCRTFEDAMRLAREGWDDIGEYMSRLYVRPQIQVPASIYVTEDFDTYNNIAGSSVNIGRYLRGAPDCMRGVNASPRFLRPAKFMTVLYSFAMPYYTRPWEYVYVGKQVFEIIESLELANIRTEVILHAGVYAVDDNNVFNGFYDVYVRVKKAGEPLNYNRIGFAVMHPAFFRRLCFSEFERNPRDVVKQWRFYLGEYYGVVRHLSAAEVGDGPDVLYFAARDLSDGNIDRTHALCQKVERILRDSCSRGR